jgi:hypothetical protein
LPSLVNDVPSITNLRFNRGASIEKGTHVVPDPIAWLEGDRMTFVELYRDYLEVGSEGLVSRRANLAVAGQATQSMALGHVSHVESSPLWNRAAVTLGDHRRALAGRFGSVAAMSAAAAACLGGALAVGSVAQFAVGTPTITPKPSHPKVHPTPSQTTPSGPTNSGGSNAGSSGAFLASLVTKSTGVAATTHPGGSGSGVTISTPPPKPPPSGGGGPIGAPTGVGAVVNDLATTVAATVSNLTTTVGSTTAGLVGTLGGTVSGGVGTVGALLHLV